MKEIVDITKIAQMCNITTETLRYYDRIDLIKPVKRDESTGVRYYSIQQYEKIITIKELQQMGLSLKEIKEYLENRNIKTTYDILLKEKKIISEKIYDFISVKKKIDEKISFIEKLMEKNLLIEGEIEEKIFETRYYLVGNKAATTDVENSYEAIMLINKILGVEKYIPVFASNVFTGYTEKESLAEGDYRKSLLMINVPPKSAKKLKDDNTIKVVEGGKFLCKCYVGDYWSREETVKEILDYAKTNNYLITGGMITEVFVDEAITDDENEISFEIQIPVSKA